MELQFSLPFFYCKKGLLGEIFTVFYGSVRGREGEAVPGVPITKHFFT